MNAITLRTALIAGLFSTAALTGCSSMSKGTMVGAGVGGATGAVITNGSPVGAAVGAVVGGAVGNEIEKRDKK